jgi:iron(III) transport system substrate-binding protein
MRRLLAAVTALAALLPLAACGGSDADLTIYSGRNEQLVGDLLDRFEERSGLKVDVRYGDSAELAATIAEEGDNSPADVFFSQDAGALGSIEERLVPLPRAVLARVDERFRDPRGRWVGVSGRARVIAYSTERVERSELPRSVFDVVGDEWRGRVGFAPPNASFQAFVSGMRLDAGDDRTREWLGALVGNEAKRYENNIQTVEAIDRGEIDLGLVNHYYLYELRRENPGLAVANHFLGGGDPGALVNAAGAAVLATSGHRPDAERFVRFLLEEEAQRYFSRVTAEYPLIQGIARRPDLPPLDEVIGPDVALGDLGPKLRSTLRMLDEAGLTT